jgi:hypothetical protein
MKLLVVNMYCAVFVVDLTVYGTVPYGTERYGTVSTV